VPDVYDPTRWVDDAQLSFLVPLEECRHLLVATDSQERAWHDRTPHAVAQEAASVGSLRYSAGSSSSRPIWKGASQICSGIMPRGD
jgi:hypothetical protein